MTLPEHLVVGGLVAGALAPSIGVEAAGTFWAASVLIDADHYWDYLYRNGFRDWSVRRMFRFHAALFPRLVRRPDFLGLNLFHTVEALSVMALAGFGLGVTAAVAALLGMLLHLGCDLARLATHGSVFKRATSIVEYAIRRRRLIRCGLDPDCPYREALAAIGLRCVPAAEPIAGRQAVMPS